jgi:hypothetical protein
MQLQPSAFRFAIEVEPVSRSGFDARIKLTFGRSPEGDRCQDSACGGAAREDEAILRYGL